MKAREKINLILASASPRRKRILEDLGVDFDVVIPEIEEVHWDDRPEASVRENARLKCTACAALHPDARIIAADTLVVFEGKPLGKPTSLDEAALFLKAFSGKSQEVYTGVAFYTPGTPIQTVVDTSTVTFRKLTDKTIQEYFADVNPLDKAGAYDIDQRTDLIIKSWTGSRTNIMGLPRQIIADWLNNNRNATCRDAKQ